MPATRTLPTRRQRTTAHHSAHDERYQKDGQQVGSNEQSHGLSGVMRRRQRANRCEAIAPRSHGQCLPPPARRTRFVFHKPVLAMLAVMFGFPSQALRHRPFRGARRGRRFDRSGRGCRCEFQARATPRRWIPGTRQGRTLGRADAGRRVRDAAPVAHSPRCIPELDLLPVPVLDRPGPRDAANVPRRGGGALNGSSGGSIISIQGIAARDGSAHLHNRTLRPASGSPVNRFREPGPGNQENPKTIRSGRSVQNLWTLAARRCYISGAYRRIRFGPTALHHGAGSRVGRQALPEGEGAKMWGGHQSIVTGLQKKPFGTLPARGRLRAGFFGVWKPG